MTNKYRRYITVLLIVVMVIIMVGCGENIATEDEQEAQSVSITVDENDFKEKSTPTETDNIQELINDGISSQPLESDEGCNEANVEINQSVDNQNEPLNTLSGEYNVYLDILYDESVVMAQYDIDIYLGSEKIGTVSKGYPFILQTMVYTNVTDLTFYDSLDNCILTTKKIMLNGDSTIRCRLVSHTDSIDINDFVQISGIVGAYVAVPDTIDEMLSDAVSLLKNLGFFNIKYQSAMSENVWDTENWIVINQNIPAGTETGKNTEIVLDVIRVDDYVADVFIGKDMNSAGKIAEEKGFTVTYCDIMTGEDILPKNLSGYEILMMKIESVISTSGNMKHAKLGVAYSGELVVPNVTDMDLPDALERLKEMRFSNITVHTDDGTDTFDEDKWIVVSQSFLEGQRIAADREIVLNVIKFVPPTPTATPTPIPSVTPTLEVTPTPEPSPIPNRKEGKSGVYTYENYDKSSKLTFYIMIDFDEGYVYICSYDGSSVSCEKTRIISGDMNTGVLIMPDYGYGQIAYSISFKWRNMPENMQMADWSGNVMYFDMTDVDNVKKIINKAKKVEVI